MKQSETLLTETQYIKFVLPLEIEKEGNMRRFAKKVRVSPAYLHNVVNGKKPPSSKLLAATGYERLPMVRMLKKK